MSTHQQVISALGSKEGGREAAQRVPHAVFSNGCWLGWEQRQSHDQDVAWQEGQNIPLQPVMHPGVPDGTGESDNLYHSPVQVRGGHSWVSTDQGAGREKAEEGEKERKEMIKTLD